MTIKQFGNMAVRRSEASEHLYLMFVPSLSTILRQFLIFSHQTIICRRTDPCHYCCSILACAQRYLAQLCSPRYVEGMLALIYITCSSTLVLPTLYAGCTFTWLSLLCTYPKRLKRSRLVSFALNRRQNWSASELVLLLKKAACVLTKTKLAVNQHQK